MHGTQHHDDAFVEMVGPGRRRRVVGQANATRARAVSAHVCPQRAVTLTERTCTCTASELCALAPQGLRKDLRWRVHPFHVNQFGGIRPIWLHAVACAS